MIDLQRVKFRFSEWLRIVFTRRVYVAVSRNEIGELAELRILAKLPKGMRSMTPEEVAAAQERMEANRQELLRQQQEAAKDSARPPRNRNKRR